MSESFKLLLVDDDPSLLRALQIGLSARGYLIIMARTGNEGIDQVALTSPDVVLLDLGLPDIDGVEVVRRLRQWSKVPILVLSASGDEDRKVTALDAGADDYLTKPFGMAELEARVRVALRHKDTRSNTGGQSRLVSSKLTIDYSARQVQVGDTQIELTAREFDLLAYLARNIGKVCTHRMILREVWGVGYGEELHYLRVYANRIRRKLGDDAGEMIQTKPGIGYQLVLLDSDSP